MFTEMRGWKKFVSGSEDAFTHLYSRFQKPIFSYVRSKVPDEEVAHELTQEVFMRVFRFRGTYERQYAFSTWLWTIARNTVTDHFRSRKAMVEAGGHNEGVDPDELPSLESCAETLILRKDQKRNLLKVMKSLTRMQKRVLWMRVIHQLPFQEIARQLGLSLSAVKNLAHRAKATLTEAGMGGLAYA